MARGSLQIHARLEGAAAAKGEADSLDRRLDDATRDFVHEAAELVHEGARSAIQSIAGGVYWDINVQVAETPHGGVARVSTPSSKPHIIRPIPPNTRLTFRIPGVGWRSPREVHHPGSRPVDWPDRLGGTVPRLERSLEEHVGRVLRGG